MIPTSNQHQLFLETVVESEVTLPKRRGRRPGQAIPKGADLTDQQVLQKLLSLSKRSGRTPDQLAALLTQYLDKYRQILELRRKADELEHQLELGREDSEGDPDEGEEGDSDDLEDTDPEELDSDSDEES